MKSLCKDRISAIIEKWYMLEPLYFALWTSHELHIDSQIATLRSGAGKIDYNPDFIQSLDEATLEQVLRFEAMRLLLKHPYQRRKPQARLSYQASNITVQEYLNTQLPIANAEQTFQSNDSNHLYFERYYQLLAEMSKSGSGGDSGSSSSEKSQNNANNEFSEQAKQSEEQSISSEFETGEADSKIKPATLETYADDMSGEENTENWEANEYHCQKINEKIEFAQQNHQWGSISGQVQASILATLKPRLNYRDMLKHFRASILSNKRCLTRMKPSRRYGFAYMGSRRDFNTHLLVAVDISGSVSDHDVQCAFSVINQLFKYGIEVIDVIQFDTQIKGEVLQLNKARYQIDIQGRGGTDFQAPLNYIDQHRQYDGLIIYTDGYAQIPKAPQNRKTKLFWLFNHQQNYQAAEQSLKNLGRAGFILD